MRAPIGPVEISTRHEARRSVGSRVLESHDPGRYRRGRGDEEPGAGDAEDFDGPTEWEGLSESARRRIQAPEASARGVGRREKARHRLKEWKGQPRGENLAPRQHELVVRPTDPAGEIIDGLKVGGESRDEGLGDLGCVAHERHGLPASAVGAKA